LLSDNVNGVGGFLGDFCLHDEYLVTVKFLSLIIA